MAKKKAPRKPALGGGQAQNQRRIQQSVLASPKLADEEKAPRGIPMTMKRKELRAYLIAMMRDIPGLLTVVDGPAVDDAVDAILMRRQLEKELRNNKIPMINSDLKPVEAWKYLRQLRDREHKLIGELGLNPMMRKSVHVEKKNLSEDLARRGIPDEDNVVSMPESQSPLEKVFGDDAEVLEFIRAFTGEEVA